MYGVCIYKTNLSQGKDVNLSHINCFIIVTFLFIRVPVIPTYHVEVVTDNDRQVSHSSWEDCCFWGSHFWETICVVSLCYLVTIK